MHKRVASVNKNKFLILLGVLFLLSSLAIGIILTMQQQNIQKMAAVLKCPSAEQCPVTADKTHLRSCHPGECDGSPTESLCNDAGRVETCGPDFTKYCCPKVNGIWTKDMTKCTTATPVPSPTSSSTLNSWDVNEDGKVNIVDIGLIIDYYSLSPSLYPRADVNSDGLISIVDIGIVIDHYTF